MPLIRSVVFKTSQEEKLSRSRRFGSSNVEINRCAKNRPELVVSVSSCFLMAFFGFPDPVVDIRYITTTLYLD